MGRPRKPLPEELLQRAMQEIAADPALAGQMANKIIENAKDMPTAAPKGRKATVAVVNQSVVRKAAPKSRKAAAEDITAEIRPGTKNGFCDIVFSGKPSQEVLDELKGHGFRFSLFGGVPHWWGPIVSLPEQYKGE